MGAGKSTIGKQLAKKLGKTFIDSDVEIEKKTGVSIDLIFDIEGEEGFRKREHQMTEELSKFGGSVIATGGGVVLDEENRKILQSTGKVIYLRASLESLLKRTEKDRSRPLLMTEDRHGKIKGLLESREPLYLEIADYVVDTENATIKQIVKDIYKKITTYGKNYS